MSLPLEAELPWLREQMPVTAAAIERLPDMNGVRLACSMHLEPKMIPALEGLLERGAQLHLTTCNADTVNDRVVAHVEARGAKAHAWRGMPAAERARALRSAAEFAPTHLCEMGADLTAFFLAPDGAGAGGGVRGGLEATGSGLRRLSGLPAPTYPIFNWDTVPIKQGLHNRHMVGLTACQAFFERTRLTFHNRRVLVVGFGPVGRSVCDAARAYGGRVLVAEIDPAHALQARFSGEEVVPLDEALPRCDVVITATGARGVLGPAQFPRLAPGAFLVNVGHVDEEIDVPALLAHPHEEVMPQVERVKVGERVVYLFARGSMANLVAGHGDSLNAFDITAAIMVAGLGFLVRVADHFAPGVHVLPPEAWLDVARAAMARD
jgi:adenosylhomocysteinase